MQKQISLKYFFKNYWRNVGIDKYMQLTIEQRSLYNTAWECLKLGYYTHADFVKFLWANGINLW